MRRIFAAGIVLFVAGAFTVAALTGGQGSLFLAALVAAAVLLIGVVFVMAFSEGVTLRRRSPARDFLAFEKAARYVRGGALGDASMAWNPRGFPTAGTANETAKISARAFVETLVPAPRPAVSVSSAGDRKAFLDALRADGSGLFRLANVTGIDVTPYQAFLADARSGAHQGDWGATLRSLQLANELLRATIEKFLVKRKRAGEPAPDLDNF